jgi:ligand-binding sensor domain-containing protein/signal transduction histidine kinase
LIHSSKRLPVLIIRSLALVVTLTLLIRCSEAQTIYFRHYEIENGLSNNTVITSLQDKDGFLWFGTSDGLNRFDGYDFKTFRIDQSPATGSASNAIFYLYQDSKGTLWVGASKGLYFFNKQDGSFTRLPHTQGKWVRAIQCDAEGNVWFVEGGSLFKYEPTTGKISGYPAPELKNITTLYQSSDGTLWLGCEKGVLARYQVKTQQFDYYASPEAAGNNNTIEAICEYGEHDLLIGTSRTGLLQFDRQREQWTAVALSRDRLFIRSILKAADHEYWIGSEAGLFILNSSTDSIRHLHKTAGDPYSITDNAIYSLCKDKEGGIWVGTYFGGINYAPNHSMRFEKFYPQASETSIRGSVVREMVQDQYGKMWIGTEDKGLSQFDPVRQVFKNYSDQQGGALNIPTNIHGLLADGDKLYIGTFENGLYVLDIPTGTIKQHHVAYANNGLNSNYINILYKTLQGAILACTANGLYSFDAGTQQFKEIAGLPGNCFYSAVMQDSKGRIWIGTHDQGVYCIDQGETKKLSIRYKAGYLFDDTKVVNFLEDRDGYLWVCTESGLFRISPNGYTVSVYNTESGMPGNMVCSTVQDANGNIWASTSRGLACIDLHHQLVKVFRQSDGLLSNQFNHRSAFKDTAGNIYFGSLKGFVRFNPSRSFVNQHIPPIFFTGMQVYNKAVSAHSLYTFPENFILNNDPIRLAHNRSTFSLDFAALSYTSTENIEYAYKLAGPDEKWNFIGKDRRIHFNNLSPGSYVINIKSTNGYGAWVANERSIAIEVAPPFYKTLLAYLIYAIVLAGLLGLIARYFYNRHREKQLRTMEIFALNKEKELYQFKIDFFTKVAHEIRTPLTLIKAPMEKIFQSVESLPDIKHEVVVMNKNTNRLLTLINQLLDFRKVETGNYWLHTAPMDIVAIVRELYDNFQPKAAKKGIQYQFNAEQPSVICNVDKEGIITIVGNLLDNAIKYSDAYLLVEISVATDAGSLEEQAIITVSNDGPIIPEKDRSYIFDAFYSAGNSSVVESTGIGLSLARSVALLHKGSLTYNTDGKYNIFTFSLPVSTFPPAYPAELRPSSV